MLECWGDGLLAGEWRRSNLDERGDCFIPAPQVGAIVELRPAREGLLLT